MSINSSDAAKRKFDQVDQESESSDEDEESLFLPQAREVLTQAKKSNITELKEIPENLSTGDEDDSDQWLTEEEQLSEDLNEEDSDEESVKTEEEQEDPIDEEEPGETIEELGAGREEKEEDDVVTAISNAALAPERKKPHDLRSPSMVTDLSFHPTEELIAICNIEGEIFCYKYDNDENELLHTLNHHKNKACRSLTFNRNGALLFSASKDKSVVLTDTATMTVTQNFRKAHSSPIYSLLSMDENIWASGDDDGVVKVWDARRNTQQPIFEIKEMDEFVSCMVTDDNCRLLLCTSGEGTLAAFNPRAKKMVGQSEVYPSEMNCLALIKQDTKVLTGLGNGNMYIFDWKMFGYHSDGFNDHTAAINCMLPITDNIVLTGCDDGKIRAVNLFPHRFIGVIGNHRFPIERLDISSCGHYVASSSHDGRVRFWNISFFEDPDLDVLEQTTKKSVRNKKRSLRKEKMGFHLPSSGRKNKGDFFAGFAEQQPAETQVEEPEQKQEQE